MRVAKLKISYELLHDALHMPDSCVIKCVYQDEADIVHGIVTLVVEDPALPELLDGEVCSIVDPIIRAHYYEWDWNL